MNDELQAQVLEVVQNYLSGLDLSALGTSYHKHTGTDSPQLEGKALIGAPQAAIPADVGGTAGSSYNSTAQNLINNHTAQIDTIKTALKNLGFTL